MTSSRKRRDRGKGNCADTLRMRLQRARRIGREMTAQGAAAQLLAILTALVGSAPVLPATRVSPDEPSTGAASTEGRVTSFRPPPTVDEAMRDIRSARQMTPRVKSSIAVLKRLAPSAGDWIDDKATWLEWSDITRCLVPGDEKATSLRLTASASAWRSDKRTTKDATNELKADGTTFRP